MTDSELLRSYVETRSDAAFRELVRRHVSLVYAAALRQLDGAVHRAEDVTQSVFVDLARKAPALVRRDDLAGWLYTSTRFAATKLKRTEVRRQRREETAVTDPAIAHEREPDWVQLRGVLDEAMGELPAIDRTLIVRRYFQGRRFGEIGRDLGLKEDAARRRVDRAVERLRTLLAPHGITSTVGALSACLTSHATAPVPAGLEPAIAASIGQASMAPPIFGSFKLKALLAAAAIGTIGVVGVVVWVRAPRVARWVAAESGPAVAAPARRPVAASKGQTWPLPKSDDENAEANHRSSSPPMGTADDSRGADAQSRLVADAAGRRRLGLPIAGGGSLVELDGAGSAALLQLMPAWANLYAKIDPTVLIFYHSVGSVAGRRGIIDHTVDFATLDAPLNDSDVESVHLPVAQFPIATESVAVVFNLPDCPLLRLDRSTLAQIYGGRVEYWNDPRIAALNPGVVLPAWRIKPVMAWREPSATGAFGAYLGQALPAAATTVVDNQGKWVFADRVSMRTDMIARVRDVPGAIGYAVVSATFKAGLGYAWLQNPTGRFVPPTMPAVMAAMAGLHLEKDPRLTPESALGAEAYPMVMTIWIAVPTYPNGKAKERKLREFLRWLYHDGDPTAIALGFAPLLPEVRDPALARLDQMDH